MLSSDSLETQSEHVNAGYVFAYKQIRDFVQCDPAYLFTDEIAGLLNCIHHFYQQIKAHADKIAIDELLTSLLTLVWQLLHDDECNSQAYIKEWLQIMAEMQEKSLCCTEVYRYMQMIMDENFQALMIANIQFNSALQASNFLIRSDGEALLKTLNKIKNSAQDKSVITQVLRRSKNLLDDPHQQIDSYLHFANKIQGKSSSGYYALGQAMKWFGLGVYTCGFVLMMASVAIFQATLSASGATALLGFGAMLVGFVSWSVGKELVEKARVKGLSKKMNLFAQTVSESEKFNSQKHFHLKKR